MFGSSPYSVQHGGCGERGARVTLPADSLVQADTVAEDTGETERRSLAECMSLCTVCISVIRLD